MICIASTNPVKINAALEGFRQMFPDQQWQGKGISVESGVSDQPMTCDETYCGAVNRVNRAFDAVPEADYWVGIEGGLEQIHDRLAAFAWIVIRSKNQFGKGRTGTFFLAPAIEELVHRGFEMGHVDDKVFQQTNSKTQQGATGILTHGLVDRTAFYVHGTIMALIPFKNPSHYPNFPR